MKNIIQISYTHRVPTANSLCILIVENLKEFHRVKHVLRTYTFTMSNFFNLLTVKTTLLRPKSLQT